MIRLKGRNRFGGAYVLIVLGLLFGALGSRAGAASLVLKMRAFNPSTNEAQTVEVKHVLPKPAGKDDLIDIGDFKIGYDVANQVYFVHKKVELAPGTNRTFEVAVKDVWILSPQTLQESADHARLLGESLKGTEQLDTGVRLRGVIEQNLKAIRDRQDASAIGVVRPVDHIAAYESNLQALEQVRKDMGVLENLVVAAGKDPQKILGASQAPPPPGLGSSSPTGNTVVVRVKVTNPSLTAKKKLDFKHELPVEVKPGDVVEAAGLQTGYDSVKNLTYVYTNELELEPSGSREFSVVVRNPWGALPSKIARLQSRANDLHGLVKETKEYPSVETEVRAVLGDLQALSREQAPEGMNEQYVAFERRQSLELMRAEGRLMRLEELFQSHEKAQQILISMPNLKPPSRRSTWIIIYSILGFLGVVSLLFYLRWYGKTQSEQLDRTPGQSAVPPGSAGGSGGDTTAKP